MRKKAFLVGRNKRVYICLEKHEYRWKNRWNMFPNSGLYNTLFSNNDIPVALDMAQLVAIEVDNQFPQARMGRREVDFNFGVFPWSHRAAQPGR